MKYGWMLYPRSTAKSRFGNNAFEWMSEAARQQGIKLDIVFIDDLIIDCSKEVAFYDKSEQLDKPDFVIIRCYNMIISSQLEKLGIPVINDTLSMYHSRNKVITAQILNRAGIPTPRTVYTAQNDYTLIADRFGGRPFVMKYVEGSGGKNVFLIKNGKDFAAAFAMTHGYFLCQEFVENSYGKDIRVYVLGDKVLGCVLRKSRGGFRANFSLGGSAEAFELTDEIEQISIKAAQALNLQFCGIDLLFGSNGLTVCEMNGNAGFRTITQVSDVDIAQELFDYVESVIY